MTDQLDAPVVVVNRWTRYGKDRAYVSCGDQQWGHRDLQTGEVVCANPAHRTPIEAATAELWRAAQAKRYAPRHASEPAPTPAPAPAPAIVAPDTAPAASLLPDRDLTAHRPGQAARAQATDLREV